MFQKVNMKRFIYFFVFFLLLTLALFYVLERLGAEAIQDSLINSSENQINYTEGMLSGVISEATMLGIQYTADKTVEYYQAQKRSLSAYDSQMQKNQILDRITDTLLSNQSVDSIGIYWKSEHEFITSSHDPLARAPFESVTKRGWKLVDGSLYYFSLYPYIKTDQPAQSQYIVGVKLNMDALSGLLDKAFQGSDTHAFWLIQQKMMIGNQPVDQQLADAAKRTVTPNSEAILKFNYESREGRYYVLSKYIEPLDGYLVTYTRTNPFFDPLNRNHQVFYGSILVILVIGLFVILMFYRHFYRNVHLLDRKFVQVEQGHYTTRITENPDNEFIRLFKSFNHMVSKIQALFESLRIETELRRHAELKQLQAQINPHFLYNSLFFIMSMARTSPEAVTQMSKHLAEYYRYLTKTTSEAVTLGSELELADHYLSIMSLSKEIDYDINVSPGLADQRIMPLILQPIVENAIQHGIEERHGAYRVAIEVTADSSGTRIAVSDDGKGLSPDELKRLKQQVEREQAPEEAGGVGLWNIHRRLKNSYGETSGLQFAVNEWGGLTVTLTIDFSRNGGGAHAAFDRG
ncbi:sensor histidine kinase [Paenibacillus methanolicus]|uniref:Two-component system sensor histidine kinase YesM n=1 Tax=Paenibacillus methanolicus TaxID=582686 RepID=A0A5S5C416_9BACL|nr:histidine kinase [Paenibacillus methanolicus]TYP73358.1 two-component system sensor histidine kinase YesM [Paenibacillus methanolicus]